jgi:SAM-dependent methyltransferase
MNPRRLPYDARLRDALRRVANWVDLYWTLHQRVLVEAAPLARGRLLDVGCGAKPHEPIFRPFVEQYVGVEHEASFSLTNSSTRASKPDVLYDGKRLPFDDGTFDTVLNVDVLEHTPEPARLVGEMARVLRDGGILILTAPFSFRLHELPHDYFRYTPNGLREMCRAASVTVTRVLPIGSLWSLIGHKLNSYLIMEVARLEAMGQALGKLGHESTAARPPRVWALPGVAASAFAISGLARVLDKAWPSETEALGHLIVGVREPRGV